MNLHIFTAINSQSYEPLLIDNFELISSVNKKTNYVYNYVTIMGLYNEKLTETINKYKNICKLNVIKMHEHIFNYSFAINMLLNDNTFNNINDDDIIIITDGYSLIRYNIIFEKYSKYKFKYDENYLSINCLLNPNTLKNFNYRVREPSKSGILLSFIAVRVYKIYRHNIENEHIPVIAISKKNIIKQNGLDENIFTELSRNFLLYKLRQTKLKEEHVSNKLSGLVFKHRDEFKDLDNRDKYYINDCITEKKEDLRKYELNSNINDLTIDKNTKLPIWNNKLDYINLFNTNKKIIIDEKKELPEKYNLPIISTIISKELTKSTIPFILQYDAILKYLLNTRKIKLNILTLEGEYLNYDTNWCINHKEYISINKKCNKEFILSSLSNSNFIILHDTTSIFKDIIYNIYNIPIIFFYSKIETYNNLINIKRDNFYTFSANNKEIKYTDIVNTILNSVERNTNV